MGPVKRSIMIAGHATSISLEPVFWDALREAAAAEGLPLNALVARIDAERVAARRPAQPGQRDPGLAVRTEGCRDERRAQSHDHLVLGQGALRRPS